MFIRTKKIKKVDGKEYEYAHLVNGIWRKRKLKFTDIGKKRYSKYNNSIHEYNQIIGRVYRFDNIRSVSFEDFLGCNFEAFVGERSIEDIYKKLIAYELFCCGFKKIEGVYRGSRLFVDLNRFIVHDGRSDAVLKIQERGGYLCNLSLKDLFDIKKINGRYEGMLLMKKLRMAGVNITPNNFFILARKMMED